MRTLERGSHSEFAGETRSYAHDVYGEMITSEESVLAAVVSSRVFWTPICPSFWPLSPVAGERLPILVQALSCAPAYCMYMETAIAFGIYTITMNYVQGCREYRVEYVLVPSCHKWLAQSHAPMF